MGPLSEFEYKILTLPRSCEICRETNPTILNRCETCTAVYYCSTKHQTDDLHTHKQLCPIFNLATHCDALQIILPSQYRNLVAPINPPYSEFSHKLFPTPHTLQYRKLPQHFSDLIKSPLQPIDAMISDWLSFPLTTLHALELLRNPSDKIQDKKELTILAASQPHYTHKIRNATAWEYLFHRLPLLKKLHVVTTDPTLISLSGQQTDHINLIIPLCSHCRKKDKVLIITAESNIIMSEREYPLDLILIFGKLNWSNPKSWLLPFPNPNTTVVLAQKLKENLESDLKSLSTLEELNIILQTQINPFASLRPERIHFHTTYNEKPTTSTSTNPHSTCFTYTNKYITIIRRKSKMNIHYIPMKPGKYILL